MEPDSLAIQTKDLTKRFGTFTAVDKVSFEVRRGEVFGLLGPNGAGKTTLVRMLTTLIAPSGGQAIVAGFDVARHPRQVRENIGVIPQALTSDLDLTGWENVDIYGEFFGLSRRERRERGASPAPSGRADRTRQRPGRDLLRRDAPAARNRARADSFARRAVPRRADHRTRSAEPPRGVGPARNTAPGERDHDLAHDALHGRGRVAVRSDRDRRWRQDYRARHAGRAQVDGAGCGPDRSGGRERSGGDRRDADSRCRICAR